ncbi:MAG: hypothetical protein WD513_01840 [Balneolaceae bacterium]
MRLFKFFATFLITAILIFGFVLGWNWKSFTVFLDNREALMEGNEWILNTSSLRGLSEFVGENPEFSSIVSIVITEQDSTIIYQENRSRTMGTTANLFILLAYASEIDSGHFSGDERINWEDISQYQLISVDESVHQEAYRVAEQRGWIDQNNTINLDDALRLLAEYNDLALSDYLWWQLDPEIWLSLPTELNLSSTDMPLPFSGLYLAITPQFQDRTMPDLIKFWSDQDHQDWRQFVIEKSEIYSTNPGQREIISQYLDKNRLGITFMEERDALQLFPKTTALEITQFLDKLWNLEIINEQVSQQVLDYMRWPLDSQSGIDADFTDYGALYDNRMGLMNGIDFGTSAYTGDTAVQAFFLDRLPIGFWFHASGGLMHQDFMQRLIYDPALINQMHLVISQ